MADVPGQSGSAAASSDYVLEAQRIDAIFIPLACLLIPAAMHSAVCSERDVEFLMSHRYSVADLHFSNLHSTRCGNSFDLHAEGVCIAKDVCELMCAHVQRGMVGCCSAPGTRRQLVCRLCLDVGGSLMKETCGRAV